MDSIVVKPHENDILLGRGGNNNKHIGNEKLRTLARSQVERYRNSTKKDKSKISRELVFYIRNMHPPGRFLKRNAFSEQWEDVGDDIAREKTSQALRDAVSIHSDVKSTSSAPTVDNQPLPPIPSAQNSAQLPPVINPFFSSNMQNSMTSASDRFSGSGKYSGYQGDSKNIGSIQNQTSAYGCPTYSSQQTFPSKAHTNSPQVQKFLSNDNSLLSVVSPDDPDHWKERYGSSSLYHKRFDQGTFIRNHQQDRYEQHRFNQQHQFSYRQQHGMIQHHSLKRSFEETDPTSFDYGYDDSYDFGGRRFRHSRNCHPASRSQLNDVDQIDDLDLSNFEWLPQGDAELPWNCTS